MRRIGRRWHRWGRVHWYLGNATGPLGSYGFKRARRPRPHLSSTLTLGPLYVSIWPKRKGA